MSHSAVLSPPADPDSQPTLPIRPPVDPSQVQTRVRPDSAEPASPKSPRPRIDKLPTIAGFELIRRLGHGGMGIVYLAREVALGRLVALKVVAGGVFANDEVLERFQREAEAIASLQHPNIIQIFRVGTSDGGDASAPASPYIAIEFVDSGTLAAHVGKPVTSASAARLVATLARAIQYAHDRGIIHRDLKPGNVLMNRSGSAHSSSELIDQLDPKVSDFGLAKRSTAGDSQTVAGSMLGTPEYMSPEQAAGSANVGPASDIYSLGVILYELLTGRVPFQGADSLDTLLLVRTHEPVSPCRLQARLPRDLDTICLRCLRKEPGRRYASAAELADDLEAWLDHRPIAARPTGMFERAAKWARRRPAIAGLITAVIAATTLGFAGIAWQWQRAEARADAERTALDRAEESLYFGRIHVAQQELLEGHREDATRILDSCRPRPGQRDHRSWEWYYLRNQCQGEFASFQASQSWVWDIAWSPDGKRLAVASGAPAKIDVVGTQGELAIWDLASRSKIAEMVGHQSTVRHVKFNRQGTRIVSTGYDRTARVWDVESKEQVGQSVECDYSYNHYSDPFGNSSLCWFAKDDQSIFVRNKGKWSRCFLTTGQLTPLPEWEGVGARSPDGRYLLHRKSEEEFHVTDLQTGRSTAGASHDRGYDRTAVCPDGAQLALSSSHFLTLVDPSSGRIVDRLSGPTDWIEAMEYDTAGSCLAVAAGKTIFVFRKDRETVVYHGHEAHVLCVSISPDGRQLATGDRSGQIFVWDLSRNPRRDVVHSGANSASSYALGLDETGDHAISVNSSQEFRLISFAEHTWQNKPIAGMTKVMRYPRLDVQISADGRRVYCPMETSPSVIGCWDLVRSEKSHEYRGHTQSVGGIALSSNGRRMASRAFNPKKLDEPGELLFWDLETNRLIRQITNEPVIGLALSADGSRLVASNAKSELIAWDTSDGRELWRQPAHRVENEASPFTIFGIAVSPDGQLVGSAGFRDGHARVWDAATGRPLTPPLPARPSLTGVVFSPDSRRVAAAGYDSELRMWDATTGQLAIVLHPSSGARRGDTAYTARPVFSQKNGRLILMDHHGRICRWDGREDPSTDASLDSHK